MGAKQEISEASPELPELLQRLAHRTRNPLATIRSSAQLVQHLLEPRGEISDYLEGILAEVDGLDAMLRDLVRLLQPVPASNERLDVQELVREAAGGVSKAVRESKVGLKIREGPQASVHGNREQLCEGLCELIRNGLQCTPPGEQVDVGWHPVAGGQIGLWVGDACPGIAPEIAKRMFQPFYSTCRRSGLGLNLALRAAAMAGGRLEWANGPSRGCRFTLVLPSA